MTPIAFIATPRSGETLHALLTWLRQAKVAARLPPPWRGGEAAGPARDDPHRIARDIDRGMIELGLLGLGWQPPRPAWRR